MPEVSRLLWAKDDFNDFSTHHHSRRKEDLLCQELAKISTPSERYRFSFDAQEVAGIVEKGEWFSGLSVCSFRVPGIDDRLCCDSL